ncbi:MAG: hypothetical protein VW233_07495, partial [Paracoccaceae bacterium]
LRNIVEDGRVSLLFLIGGENFAVRVNGIARLDPSWFGASVVLRGIPDFSHIPPSSRLQNDAGTTLTIDMQNRPCHLPVAEIKVDHPNEAKGFKAAARRRRGVTAWVEREGQLSVDD